MAETRHLYTGNLPLHAVFYNAFFSSSKRAAIAEMIIRANPQSVLMTNYDGRTPLHTNCTQHCNYEPVVALLRAAPQTAKWKDKNNELPLHLACRSQKTPNKSIRALFHAYPDGILCKNGQGLTPLEIAKASRVMEQRKASRVALLTSLEAQFSKAKKSRENQQSMHRERHVGSHPDKPHEKMGLGHLQHYHGHQANKRKLDMMSPEEHALWPPPKLYQKYVGAQPYHVPPSLIPPPMIVPTYLPTEIMQPRYTVEDLMLLEAIKSERRILQANSDAYLQMKLQNQKLANLELLRSQQIASANVPAQASEENVAETLLALKTQNSP